MIMRRRLRGVVYTHAVLVTALVGSWRNRFPAAIDYYIRYIPGGKLALRKIIKRRCLERCTLLLERSQPHL